MFSKKLLERLKIVQKLQHELVNKFGYEDYNVFIFGSFLTERYKDGVSDIDLAVSGGDCIRFSLDVQESTSTLLFFDVVVLDGAVQKELLDSIEKEGVCIYEKV